MTHLVSGDKVPDEQEDAHDDVLRDRDDVRARDLEHLDAALDGRVQVDVVRADARRHAELEVLGLGGERAAVHKGLLPFGEDWRTYLRDQIAGEVAGMERSCDEDLSVLEVLLEDAVRALLVVRDLHESAA